MVYKDREHERFLVKDLVVPFSTFGAECLRLEIDVGMKLSILSIALF